MYIGDVYSHKRNKFFASLVKMKKTFPVMMIVLSVFLGFSSAILATPILGASAAPATPAATGPGNNPFSYNEFIDTNSYRANVDSRGSVAVGGNLNITGSFTVADGPNITYTCSDNTLVVGGNIVGAAAGTTLSIAEGMALYSGTLTNVNIYSNANPQCNPVASSGTTSFTSAWNTAANDSSTWAGTASNSTVTVAPGGVNLTGTSPTVNYFSVAASQLTGVVDITVPTGSTSIINVTGTTYTNSVTNIEFNGAAATIPEDEATLWNFPNMTAMSFENGIQWEGAILAPLATVQYNNGKIDGNLIAYQLGTATNPANVETHERYFVPPPMTPPTTTTVAPTTTTVAPTTTTVAPTTTTVAPTTTTVAPTTTTVAPTTTTVAPTTTTVAPTTTTVAPTTTTVAPTTTTVAPTTTTVAPTTTTVAPTTTTVAPTTTTVAPNPSIAIKKSASVTSYSAPGTVITYTYVVTNTGNVTLNPVTVSDPMSGLSKVSCPDTSLAPTQTESCTATYTTTQKDVDAGSLTNVGTATGTPPTGPNVTGTSTVTIPAKQTPSIAIKKSASVTSYSAPGTVITYTYVVTNTGNVTLNPVTVSDPMSGLSKVSCPDTSLAPTQTESCTATYTTTQKDVDAGSLTNVGTATGTPPTGPNVTGTSTVTIPAKQTPSIAIKKSASVFAYTILPTPITYTYVVTNTGNVTLNPVTVTDPMPGLSSVSCPDTSLAPTQTESCTATYTTTQKDYDAGSLTNTGTATGTPPTGPNVTGTSTLTIGHLNILTPRHHKKKKVKVKAKKKVEKKVEVKAKKKVVPAPKPTKKVVVGATTVHTGEPWSGANLYLLLISFFGLLLTGLGLTKRKIHIKRV